MAQPEREEEAASFIGSVDQGTTSTRFIIFDSKGNQVTSHQIEFENHYPQSGWHEQDPDVLVQSVHECIAHAVADFTAQGHSPCAIRAIGITNQRETTVCWDVCTGRPLHRALVWPDTRTQALVRELRRGGGATGGTGGSGGTSTAEEACARLTARCGLPLSTYPAGVKLVWLLRNVEAVRRAYDERRLAFGTVDSWLVYQLNGGPERDVHVTDSTNASRTMFMDLRKRRYDDESLRFFGIDRDRVRLPTIVPSAHASAFGSLASGPLAGVRITACLGDQSAALVGHGAFAPGDAKNTYGTGCFLLCNVGPEPVVSRSGLLATVAYDFGVAAAADNSTTRLGPIAYALEGSVAVAGSGVRFLAANLGFAEGAREVGELAGSVEDSGGVVFVTAFSGLFAPYWIDDAKGTLFGLTAHTQRAHIARATLEATCFQTAAILSAMARDVSGEADDDRAASGNSVASISTSIKSSPAPAPPLSTSPTTTPLRFSHPTRLAVDGGMSASDVAMQAQADIAQIEVVRPAMQETTALGAAVVAALGVGMWSMEEGWVGTGRGRGKKGGKGGGDLGEGEGKGEGDDEDESLASGSPLPPKSESAPRSSSSISEQHDKQQHDKHPQLKQRSPSPPKDQTQSSFHPQWTRQKAEARFRRWEKAVEMSRGWVDDGDGDGDGKG